MLKERVITGLGLIAFILGALFILPAFWFQMVIVAVFALAAWEWADRYPLFFWQIANKKGRGFIPCPFCFNR